MGEKIIEWHRIFGLSLQDYFSDTPYEVELEKDVAITQQFLDVAIIRRKDGLKSSGNPAASRKLCDGFDRLNQHNLLTYKSQHEPLDEFAIQELIGHYIGYRKIKENRSIPASEINLYAACVHYPSKLAKTTPIAPVLPGVYEMSIIGLAIRIIVLSQISEKQHNAILNYFSNNKEKVNYAFEVYREHSRRVSTVFQRLLHFYKEEGLDMPLTLDSWFEENLSQIIAEAPVRQRLKGLKPEERLEGLKPEERLEGLKPEERLEGLKPEERLEGLKPEEVLRNYKPEEVLRNYKPEEVLKALSPEQLKALREKLQQT